MTSGELAIGSLTRLVCTVYVPIHAPKAVPEPDSPFLEGNRAVCSISFSRLLVKPHNLFNEMFGVWGDEEHTNEETRGELPYA